MPDAIILCGGAGVRLQSVTGGEPKPLANIAGRPFLELLLQQLRRHGFQRVILAAGYRAEAIRSRFGETAFGLNLEYSIEPEPLGTAGALRQASALVRSDDVLVLNGDSYTDADVNRLLETHRKAEGCVSIVVVPADGREDCGSIAAAEDGKLIRFSEKESVNSARYINAGIYVFSRRLFGEIPLRPSSLEREVLPRWLAEGKNLRVFVQQTKCVDIGTPARYDAAQILLAGAEPSLAR